MLALFALSTLPAFADGDYTDDTPCSQIDTALTQQNRDDFANFIIYVQNVFSSLDAGHIENGEPGVAGQWSDEGTRHNVVAVASWCEKHPKETVYNASAEIYNSLRALEMALGAAK